LILAPDPGDEDDKKTMDQDDDGVTDNDKAKNDETENDKIIEIND
jgi:hypothetical protein